MQTVRVTALSSGRQADGDITRLQNRAAFAESLIDLKAFARLSSLAEKAVPDIVIMAARRMPRAVQLARFLDPSLFAFKSSFYSDFALEFLGDRLRDAKVVIIDDAVNIGSTLVNIYERVLKHKPAAISCCALARKRGSISAYRQGFPLQFACKNEWSETEYKGHITDLSRSLWVLNLPMEVEFPIYKYSVDKSFLSDLPRILEDKFGTACHRLDIDNASFMGLHRFSVDLAPGENVNNKIRLYADTVLALWS